MVRSKRIMIGMSTTALGQAIGYDNHNFVSMIEGGYRIPMPKVRPIAQALNMRGQEKANFIMATLRTWESEVFELVTEALNIRRKLATKAKMEISVGEPKIVAKKAL